MSRGHRIFLSCFLPLLLLPPIFGQVNLSHSLNASNDPDIAFDSKGRAVIVWAEANWPIPNISEIFCSVRQNGFWLPGRETFSQLYSAGLPGLCVDHNDSFHLVYADGWNFSSRDIFHRRMELEDGFWSNVERVLRHVLDSSHPRIVVSSEGTVFALWEQVVVSADQTKIVMNSKPEGQPWGDKWVNVSLNTNSKTAFPSLREHDGILHACWMDNRNGSWDIFYSQRLSDYWDLPAGLGGAEEKLHPALSLDQNGQVHIVYGTAGGDIFHVRRINQTWSSPQLISSAVYPGGSLDIQTFPNGILHAVWPETTATGVSLYCSRAAADGTWQQPFKIADGIDAACPKIASDPEGQAHVVWTDLGVNGKSDIYYLQVIPPGSQPDAQMIYSDSEGIVPFTSLFDASPSSTPQGQLISTWWDFGDGTEKEQGIQVSHTYQTAGTFTARLYVTNSQLNVDTESVELQILAGPFPPGDVTVQKAENKALFYREEINSISWTENYKNNAFSPVESYFIYRRLKSQGEEHFMKIGQVDAETFVYADRLFVSPDDLEIYAYAVSAVDAQGREGPKAEALSIPAGSQKSLSEKKRRNSG